MYNIKLNDYVPTPNPAKPDRIVAAHYYAAWKYGAAGVHEGFNDLADNFPDRTPLMGYYDEENPEVCDWEIKWAVEHGINCFIHCWYRKKDNYGKPITVKDLRCGHGIHEALFNARYQQLMKFAIMYEASPLWSGTDEKDMIENLMPFWMETYFKRGNYLIIDNKPVLFVFNQDRLANECFKSVESQRETFDKCREYAKAHGFDGMIFAVCDTTLTMEKHNELMERGYDFRFGYYCGYWPPYDFYDNQDEIVKGQCEVLKKQLEIDNKRFIPTPSCFRDTTPRRTERWRKTSSYNFALELIWYISPEKYRELLCDMKNICDSLPEDAWARKIIMIDNWNEWDEGHFVAPSHKYGFKFLQAIREVFTERENLPDYRSPQDQGFVGYNTSWRVPDFKKICEKELNKQV